MNQRVMIAMAIACNPQLLIADEPTTALDVTIQAQILDLLRDLQRERGMALVLVTHNMGVVAEMARRVAVMYAGQVLEERAADELFAAPQHPYTAALLEAMPERSAGHARLATIPGVVPGLYDRPSGCLFAPRCEYATDAASPTGPRCGLAAGDVRCHYPMGDPAREAAIERDRPWLGSTHERVGDRIGTDARTRSGRPDRSSSPGTSPACTKSGAACCARRHACRRWAGCHSRFKRGARLPSSGNRVAASRRWRGWCRSWKGRRREASS